MLTVHHLNNSRSQRVLWLLEELGIALRDQALPARRQDMMAPKELRAVHPLGKSPVITDDGATIAESGAIIEYIVDTYGNGRLIPPPNTPERLRYTYWLHYAEGSAMPPLLLKLLFTMMPQRAPLLFCGRWSRRSPTARCPASSTRSSSCTWTIGRASSARVLLRRPRLHRRRHPDELPARSRVLARRARPALPKRPRLAGAESRPPRLQPRAGKRRAVSDRQGLSTAVADFPPPACGGGGALPLWHAQR